MPTLSHLISRTSTKSSLYLANSLATFIRDTDLHSLTTCTKSHVPLILLRWYQRISPCPRHMYPFRNKVSFCGEKLLAPPPKPKLEDHLLSTVRIYALYWRSVSIRNLRIRRAVVTETKLSWRHKIYGIQNVVKWTNNKQTNYDQDNKHHAICWMLTPVPHVYPQFVLCSQKVAPCLLLSFLVLKSNTLLFRNYLCPINKRIKNSTQIGHKILWKSLI